MDDGQWHTAIAAFIDDNVPGLEATWDPETGELGLVRRVDGVQILSTWDPRAFKAGHRLLARGVTLYVDWIMVRT